MAYTAENWPITAALLQFPGTDAQGTHINDAEASAWAEVLTEVKDAGFTNADLTDSWVRPGDLSSARLAEFKQTADNVGIGIPVISAIRRSVIEEGTGKRTWPTATAPSTPPPSLAARLSPSGCTRPSPPSSRSSSGSGPSKGYKDPVGDKETWGKAVTRLRELGRHAAEVGVLLSLEMYEDTYLGTADSSVQLVQDIGLANVGLNPDIGNLIRLHRPIEDWREMVAKTLPYSNYWHMKNYIRDEDVARDTYVAMPAPMESGLINYREAFKVALSVGFQGILCTEHYGGDGLSVTASNQDYLRRQVLPKTDGYALGQSQVAQGRQQPAATALAGV